MSGRNYVSYSEIKTWEECSYKHNLIYVNDIRLFSGNEFTAFGKAIHAVSEKFLVDKTAANPASYFENRFVEELQEIRKKTPDVELDRELIRTMRENGQILAELVVPSVTEYFGDHEIISVEEELHVKMPADKHFKGYIDLVLKIGDTYHIMDWKTCGWGWNARRKSDRITTYQLAYYKHFFCQKHGIDPKKVKTYFGLLKRTAKKNHVEIFEVSCGEQKIEKALNLMEKVLYNVDNNINIKNRLSCGRCEFYKTKHCR
jgi:ATP-dependent exoDNAse (exonuclease V) beta subunit